MTSLMAPGLLSSGCPPRRGPVVLTGFGLAADEQPQTIGLNHSIPHSFDAVTLLNTT